MTTLPPNHRFGRRTNRKSRTVRPGVIERFWNHEVCTIGEGLIVAGVASLALVIGCVAQRTTPIETVFDKPITIALPIKELDDTIAAAQQADDASRETTRAINAIDASNVLLTKPEAARWSQKTSEAIQSALTHAAKAKSINEVAADRIIEATNQTNDARTRLKESEMTRALERDAAKKAIDKANKQIESLRAVRGQYIGYGIAGLGALCVMLGGIGFIGQKFIKMSFGAAVVGLALIGIGLAVVNYAVWVSIIGVAIFAGFIIGGTIYFVRRANSEDDKKQVLHEEKLVLREAAKSIAKSVDVAVDVVPDFEIPSQVKTIMNSIQTNEAKALVNEAQVELGKKPAPK